MCSNTKKIISFFSTVAILFSFYVLTKETKTVETIKQSKTENDKETQIEENAFYIITKAGNPELDYPAQ